MRTIIVDDEAWNLTQLQEELEEYPQIEIVGVFDDPREAVSFAEEHTVEFAILDVEMPFIDGMRLGEKLRVLYPSMLLIYLTGYEQYVGEAILNIKADYYLLKPYDHEKMKEMVQRVTALSTRLDKRVRIQCFGSFEVFIDGKLIHFTNKKARELLALCIFEKGGHVTMEKAVDCLWEERPYDEKVKGIYRKAVIYLNSVFRENGINRCFENGRGYCCVHAEQIDCDFFDWLENRRKTEIQQMTPFPEFEWAEGFFLHFGSTGFDKIK